MFGDYDPSDSSPTFGGSYDYSNNFQGPQPYSPFDYDVSSELGFDFGNDYFAGMGFDPGLSGMYGDYLSNLGFDEFDYDSGLFNSNLFSFHTDPDSSVTYFNPAEQDPNVLFDANVVVYDSATDTWKTLVDQNGNPTDATVYDGGTLPDFVVTADQIPIAAVVPGGSDDMIENPLELSFRDIDAAVEQDQVEDEDIFGFAPSSSGLTSIIRNQLKENAKGFSTSLNQFGETVFTATDGNQYVVRKPVPGGGNKWVEYEDGVTEAPTNGPRGTPEPIAFPTGTTLNPYTGTLQYSTRYDLPTGMNSSTGPLGPGSVTITRYEWDPTKSEEGWQVFERETFNENEELIELAPNVSLPEPDPVPPDLVEAVNFERPELSPENLVYEDAFDPTTFEVPQELITNALERIDNDLSNSETLGAQFQTLPQEQRENFEELVRGHIENNATFNDSTDINASINQALAAGADAVTQELLIISDDDPANDAYSQVNAELIFEDIINAGGETVEQTLERLNSPNAGITSLTNEQKNSEVDQLFNENVIQDLLQDVGLDFNKYNTDDVKEKIIQNSDNLYKELVKAFPEYGTPSQAEALQKRAIKVAAVVGVADAARNDSSVTDSAARQQIAKLYGGGYKGGSPDNTVPTTEFKSNSEVMAMLMKDGVALGAAETLSTNNSSYPGTGQARTVFNLNNGFSDVVGWDPGQGIQNTIDLENQVAATGEGAYYANKINSQLGTPVSLQVDEGNFVDYTAGVAEGRQEALDAATLIGEGQEATINEQQVTIGEQQTTIGDLQNNVNSLTDRVNTITTTLGERNGQIRAANTARKQAEIRVTNLETELASAQTSAQTQTGIYQDTVTNLQNNLSDAQSDLDNKTQELAGLNADVQSLTAEQNTLLTNINGLNDTILSQTQTIGQQGTTISGLQGQVSTLNQTIKSNESTINSLNQVKSDNENAISGLQSELSVANQNLADAQAQGNVNSATIGNLQTQVNSLNDQISGYQTTQQNLTDQITNLNTQKQNLNTTVGTLNTNLNTKTEELNTAKTENERLNNELATAQQNVSDRNEEIINLGNDIDKLTQDYNDTQDEYDTYVDTKVAEINDLSNQITDKDNIINDQTNTLEERQQALTEKESLVNTLNTKVSEANTTISGLESQLSDKSTEINNLNTERSGLIENVSTLEGDVSDLENQIGTQNETINSLEGTVSEQSSTIGGLQENVTELNTTVLGQKETIDSQSTTIGEQTTQIENLSQEVGTQKIDLANLEQDIIGYTGTIAEQTNTINNQVENINNLQGNVASLTNQTNELNTQITGLEQDKSALEGQLSSANAGIKSLNTQIAGLDTQIGNLNSAAVLDSQAIASLENQKAGLEIDKANLESNVSDLGAQLNNANTSIADLNNDLGIKQSELDKVNADLGDALSTITGQESTISEQSELIGEQETTIGEQETTIGEQGDTITGLENTVTNLTNEATGLQSNITSLTETKTTLEGQLSDANTNINDLNTQIAELDSDIDELQNEAVVDDEAIANLENQKAGLETDKSNLQSNITDLEGQLTTANNNITDLEQNLSDTESLLNQANTDLGIAQGTITEQTATIGEQSTTIGEQVTTIGEQSSTISEQQSVIAGLETDKLDLEGQIIDKDNQLADEQTVVNDLNSQISSLNTSIAELELDATADQGQIDSLINERDNLQGNLDSANQNLSGLTIDKNDLQIQVSELEDQLTVAEQNISSMYTEAQLQDSITGAIGDLTPEELNALMPEVPIYRPDVDAAKAAETELLGRRDYRFFSEGVESLGQSENQAKLAQWLEDGVNQNTYRDIERAVVAIGVENDDTFTMADRILDQAVNGLIDGGLDPLNSIAAAINLAEGITGTNIADIPNIGQMLGDSLGDKVDDTVKGLLTRFTPEFFRDAIAQRTGYLGQDVNIVDNILADPNYAAQIRTGLPPATQQLEEYNKIVFESLFVDPSTGQAAISWDSLTPNERVGFSENASNYLSNLTQPEEGEIDYGDGPLATLFKPIIGAEGLVSSAVQGIGDFLEDVAFNQKKFVGGLAPKLLLDTAIGGFTGIPFPYSFLGDMLLSPFAPTGQALSDYLYEQGINPLTATMDDISFFGGGSLGDIPEGFLQRDPDFLEGALGSVSGDTPSAYSPFVGEGTLLENLFSGETNLIDFVGSLGSDALNNIFGDGSDGAQGEGFSAFQDDPPANTVNDPDPEGPPAIFDEGGNPIGGTSPDDGMVDDNTEELIPGTGGTVDGSGNINTGTNMEEDDTTDFDLSYEIAKGLRGSEFAEGYRNVGLEGVLGISTDYQEAQARASLGTQADIAEQQQSVADRLRDLYLTSNIGAIDRFGEPMRDAVASLRPEATAAIDATRDIFEQQRERAMGSLSARDLAEARNEAFSRSQATGRYEDPVGQLETLMQMGNVRARNEQLALNTGTQLANQEAARQGDLTSLITGQSPFTSGIQQVDVPFGGADLFNIGAQNYQNVAQQQQYNQATGIANQNMAAIPQASQPSTIQQIGNFANSVNTGISAYQLLFGSGDGSGGALGQAFNTISNIVNPSSSGNYLNPNAFNTNPLGVPQENVDYRKFYNPLNPFEP